MRPSEWTRRTIVAFGSLILVLCGCAFLAPSHWHTGLCAHIHCAPVTEGNRPPGHDREALSSVTSVGSAGISISNDIAPVDPSTQPSLTPSVPKVVSAAPLDPRVHRKVKLDTKPLEPSPSSSNPPLPATPPGSSSQPPSSPSPPPITAPAQLPDPNANPPAAVPPFVTTGAPSPDLVEHRLLNDINSAPAAPPVPSSERSPKIPPWSPPQAPDGKQFASRLPQTECNSFIVNQLVLPASFYNPINTSRDATDTDKDTRPVATLNRGRMLFVYGSTMYRCRQPRYGVIVKGRVKNIKNLVFTLKYYLRHNFNVLFLYSGFATTDADRAQFVELFELSAHNPCFRVLLSTPPCDPGSGNYINQRVAISQGLQEMKNRKVQWVAHTRADQVITMHDFPVFMEHLIHTTVPLPAHVTDQRYRLLSTTRTGVDTRKVGFCHLDDQFMFGHIGDMIDYWGVLPQNAYLNIAQRVPTCVQDIPRFHGVNAGGDWGYGVPPPEVINCQIWLRFKDIRYDNMRRLIDERLVMLRDPFFRRIWNHHEKYTLPDMGVHLDDLCPDMSDKKEFRTNPTDPCVLLELDNYAYDAYFSCDVDLFTYNCSQARAQGQLTGDFFHENFYDKPCEKPKYWIPPR